jgi:hypothetical protein
MSEQVKVKLLCDGGYSEGLAIVGKTVNAVRAYAGYNIKVSDLRLVGYVGDGTVNTEDDLYFFAHEVELIA